MWEAPWDPGGCFQAFLAHSAAISRPREAHKEHPSRPLNLARCLYFYIRRKELEVKEFKWSTWAVIQRFVLAGGCGRRKVRGESMAKKWDVREANARARKNTLPFL